MKSRITFGVLTLLLLGGCSFGTDTPQPPAVGARPALSELPEVMRRAPLAFRALDSSSGYVASSRVHRISVSTGGAIRVEATVRGAAGALSLRTTTPALDLPARLGRVGDLSMQRSNCVENLMNRDEGMEQSWSFPSRPDSVHVRVEISGAEFVRSTSSGLHFHDPSSALFFRYAHARWIDANGRSSDVEATFSDGAIHLDVPQHLVDSSSYPAVLDPLVTAEFAIDAPIHFEFGDHADLTAVATDGTDQLVVFTSTGASGGATRSVWGTRVRSDGLVLDTPPLWISGAAGSAATAIAADFDGTNYFVVWTDYSNALWGRHVTPGGAIVEPSPLSIRPSAAFSVAAPSVAFDGTNHVLTWSDTRTGVWGARLALLSTAGAVLPPGDHAIYASTLAQLDPSLSEGGGIGLLTWVENGCVRVGRISDAGTEFDPAATAVGCAPNAWQPSGAYGDGGFLVAWADTRNSPYGNDWDVYAARLSNAGTVLDPNGIPIALGNNTQNQVKVDFDGTDFMLAWSDARNGLSVYGTRVSQGGAVAVDGGFNLDPFPAYFYESFEPAIAFAGGHHLVAWKEGTTLQGHVRGVRVATDGGLLDPGPLLFEAHSNSQTTPSVSFDGTHYLAVWEDERDYGRIYAARFGSDGVAIDPTGFLVSPNQGSHQSPASTFDGTNHVVAWHGSTGFNNRLIYAARINPDGGVLDPGGVVISNAPSSRNALFPEVASNPLGTAITWQESDYSASMVGVNPALVYAVVDGGLGVIGRGDLTAGKPMRPAIAASQTQFLVGYGSKQTDGGTEVRVLSIDGQGVSSATGPVRVATVLSTDPAPALASDGTDWLVLWSSDLSLPSGIYGSIVSSDGGAAGSPLMVGATAASERNPAAAFDGTNYVAAWEVLGPSSSWDLRGMRIDPAGVTDGGAFDIAAEPEDETNARLLGGTGWAAIVYEHFDPRSYVSADRVAIRFIDFEGDGGFGVIHDAGVVDAGVDAGFVDAGFVDAGLVDAGFVDAGATDAGATDAGFEDAGIFDAGALDAGGPDAGLEEDAGSGVIDAGAPDAGDILDGGGDAGEVGPPEQDAGAVSDGGSGATAPTGCGCTENSSNALLPWLLAAAALALRGRSRTRAMKEGRR